MYVSTQRDIGMGLALETQNNQKLTIATPWAFPAAP